MTDKIGQRNK